MGEPDSTVIISGMSEKISAAEFSYLVCRVGKVKALDMDNEKREGIVTYDDPKMAKKAVEEINANDCYGSEVKAKMAGEHFKQMGMHKTNYQVAGLKHFPGLCDNPEWHKWLNRTRDNVSYPTGGQGGQGGGGIFNVLRGQDGKPGEDGPNGKGGEGGAGGSCSIS